MEHALEPDLGVAPRLHRLGKGHHLALGALHGQHQTRVLGVRDQVVQPVKQPGLEVRDHGRRVGAQRQDLQQRRVGDKVESCKLAALALQVGRQALLDQLQLLHEPGEHVLRHVGQAARRQTRPRLSAVLQQLWWRGVGGWGQNLVGHASLIPPLSMRLR